MYATYHQPRHGRFCSFPSLCMPMADLAAVRTEIKTWERVFKESQGRPPTLDDIKVNNAIGAQPYICHASLPSCFIQPTSTSCTNGFPKPLLCRPSLNHQNPLHHRLLLREPLMQKRQLLSCVPGRELSSPARRLRHSIHSPRKRRQREKTKISTLNSREMDH